ncbi:hypothetical protein I4F81_000179 [Pyropia yezoensis]|uniref:Uncharacterized protein n=1 Tax=Pyropia yezoensis TaxID=2788 RepID=A0ACC3BJ94_PYRYE|nr:hypothetical protein I4F81_000179 [Neopyropia yezoensis]
MRLPPATSQPLRRARLGIRGYLVLYAAGLGSMLLGGAVVHAVAQPDLRLPAVEAATGLPPGPDGTTAEGAEETRPAP